MFVWQQIVFWVVVLCCSVVRGEDNLNDSYVKLYSQMQYLQEEVLRLQGEVDKLHHQQTLLKKQQLQDYVELDKRIRQDSPETKVDKANDVEQKSTKPVIDTKDKSVVDPSVKAKVGDSYTQYKHAYSLIKEKKFIEAQQALKAFMVEHPDDQLVANCHYWLGELYILDGDSTKAQNAFQNIVDHYPLHNKKPEAMYKLGRIYFDRGDKVKAKQQMSQILEVYHGKSINAVRLANDFLKANF